MLKKQITYTNFAGETYTDDFYFNLSRAEIIRLQATTKGGYVEILQKLIADRESSEVLKLYEELIKLSYGKKSADGRNFVKRPEYLEDFMSCGAFDVLYEELMTNDEKALEFINGVTPQLTEKEMETAKAADVAGVLTGNVVSVT